MSPEQARGRPADRRSDIWAFGGVLYEMVTGRRAFGGDDVSDTLASVLKTEPDWRALESQPSTVRRVVKRCLEKDPKRRFHDIADVRLDLEEKSVEETRCAGGRLVAPTKRVGAGGVGACRRGSRGCLGYLLLKRTPAPQVVRFLIAPPATGSFGMAGGIVGATGSSGAALSPDGTQLVFVATDGGGLRRLWLRPIDAFTSRPLPGTEGATLPFWSPDSRSVGFFLEGRMRRIDVGTGVAQTIATVTQVPRGASWGAADVIVFSSGAPTCRCSRVRRAAGRRFLSPSIKAAGPRVCSRLAAISSGRAALSLLDRMAGNEASSISLASIDDSFMPAPAARKRVAGDLRGAGRRAVHARRRPDAAAVRSWIDSS